MSSQNVQTSAQSGRVRFVPRVIGMTVSLTARAARADRYGAIGAPGGWGVSGLAHDARVKLRFDRKQGAVVALQP